MTIRNPVLRGFNPDPSIVRVGSDYVIATSTFEWFPAVRLHVSRDLVHWEVVGHALDDRSGLRLHGVPDSGGVWAPSLSHRDGRFWLAYSVVRTMDGDDKDIQNYLVTAEQITGPWSDPVFLGSRGFDFSFFHDDDGSHWLVGVQWDHRPEHASFSGIVLEQYLPEQQRMSGAPVTIYSQPTLVEGPNLYRVGDDYHLLLAEGGTGWNHGITTARSRTLTGRYVRDPAPAVLTSRDAPGSALAKAGHGELVQTPDGDWLMVHLASRPTLRLGERYCTLGRETCLQRMVLDDEGWFRLAHSGHHAEVEVPVGPAPRVSPTVFRDDFDADVLDTTQWSTLRAPLAGHSLTARPGWLRLRGGGSTASVFDQAMIARRLSEHQVQVTAVIDAEPATVRQAAGLIAFYDRHSWIWLQLTHDDQNGPHLRVVVRDEGTTTRSAPVPAPAGPVTMRMTTDGPSLRFGVAGAGASPGAVPGTYDLWRLSDDHGGRLRFTGAFVGVRVEDLDGTGWHADVDLVEVTGVDPPD